MEELFGIILFVLILVGSALESLWKARKKKQAGRPKEAKPRPRPAAKRPAPSRAGATRAAPRPAEAGVPRSRRPAPEPTAPTDVVEMIRHRLEEMSRGEGAGVGVEEPPAGEPPLPEAYSLEEIPARTPTEYLPRRPPPEERKRPRAAEPEPGAPVRAYEFVSPAESRRRRRGEPLPRLERLSAVQRAFVWAEILGRPAAEREEGPSTPPGLRD